MPSAGHDGPTLELAARLRAVIVPLGRSLRQQSGGRFTPTQASVLGTVLRHGPIALSALAAREQLSLPMVSKVVALLESEQLVVRTTDPNDARVSRIAISGDGRAWIEETRGRRDQWLADRLAETSADEREAVAGTVTTLERILRDPA